jgi:exosome complex RNA-binding protein Rrp42 (RNase PH superfamily)
MMFAIGDKTETTLITSEEVYPLASSTFENDDFTSCLDSVHVKR